MRNGNHAPSTKPSSIVHTLSSTLIMSPCLCIQPPLASSFLGFWQTTCIPLHPVASSPTPLALQPFPSAQPWQEGCCAPPCRAPSPAMREGGTQLVGVQGRMYDIVC